jgi:hypothetical protein
MQNKKHRWLVTAERDIMDATTFFVETRRASLPALLRTLAYTLDRNGNDRYGKNTVELRIEYKEGPNE